MDAEDLCSNCNDWQLGFDDGKEEASKKPRTRYDDMLDAIQQNNPHLFADCVEGILEDNLGDKQDIELFIDALMNQF